MFSKSIKRGNNDNSSIPDCFAGTYGIELFFKNDIPQYSNDDLLKSFAKSFNNFGLLTQTENFTSFVFNDYIAEIKDAVLPGQIAIMSSNKEIDHDSFEMTHFQSWRMKNSRDVVAECKYSLLVTDFMTSSLNYKKRIELFQKALYFILEVIPCDVLHWVRSQQFIDPNDYLKNKIEDPNYDNLLGTLNVRLFNVSNGNKGEVLMDTLGLGALGLPDLQCHFIGLDCNQVSNILYTYGDYIFNNGDVIEDGNTIQGLNKNDMWKCRHELSLMEPKRVVIDINTGNSSAAGKR